MSTIWCCPSISSIRLSCGGVMRDFSSKTGSDGLAAAVDGWERTFQRVHAHAQQGTGKFSRWFLAPLSAGSLAVWRRTQRIRNPYLRAGVRVVCALLFWFLMLGVLVIAVQVIIGMILFGLLFSIVAHFLGWNRNLPEPKGRPNKIPPRREPEPSTPPPYDGSEDE
jgi:hypothetical protein